MKGLFLVLFFLPIVNVSKAQNKGNSHFFKFYITNDSNQVLLIKFQEEWEIPGSRYKTPQTMDDFVKLKASQHGVNVNRVKLEGVYTYHHEIRPNPTMMMFFSAKYESGEPIVPSWGQDVKWFSLEEAYEAIPYDEMVYIMKQIHEEQGNVFGAFKIKYDSSGRRVGSEMIR